MIDIKPLTKLEVIEFAHKWYFMLNTHASIDEFLPMLSKEQLIMKFPESTIEGTEAFIQWHKTVSHTFFDQDHNIKFLDVKLDGQNAYLEVIVRWQARTWEPPAAKSTWLGYDAYQTWTLERDSETGNVVINFYSVDAFMPMEGSH